MTAARIRAGSFTIPQDHPCFPGHMPGHPVVPGALLLDRAIGLISALPLVPPTDRPLNVKFPGAVGPDEVVEVHYEVAGAGMVAFEGHVGARLVLAGRFNTAA